MQRSFIPSGSGFVQNNIQGRPLTINQGPAIPQAQFRPNQIVSPQSFQPAVFPQQALKLSQQPIAPPTIAPRPQAIQRPLQAPVPAPIFAPPQQQQPPANFLNVPPTSVRQPTQYVPELKQQNIKFPPQQQDSRLEAQPNVDYYAVKCEVEYVPKLVQNKVIEYVPVEKIEQNVEYYPVYNYTFIQEPKYVKEAQSRYTDAPVLSQSIAQSLVQPR